MKKEVLVLFAFQKSQQTNKQSSRFGQANFCDFAEKI